MSSRPWYQWFPGDWTADTRDLTLEEKGAYRELLDALWIYGPVPDDPGAMVKIWGGTRRSAKRLLARLRPFLREVSESEFRRNYAVTSAKLSIGYGETFGAAAEVWPKLDHAKIDAQRAKSRNQRRKKPGAAEVIHNPSLARVRRAARARAPDQIQKDQDLDLPGSGLVPPPSRACAREAPNGNGGLSPEQRAEAERIQATVEANRRAAGIEATSVGAMAARFVERLEGNPEEQPGNPVTREEEENS